MPEGVVIRHDACHLELLLPGYFQQQTLGKIRKAFKLIKDRPWQNDDARETLGQFFPEWEQGFKDRHACAEFDLLIAVHKAEEKRKAMEVLGTALFENIRRAERWLDHVKTKRRNTGNRTADEKVAQELAEAIEELKRARKPITDHEDAIREVRKLEKEVKESKAALERGRKIIKGYKAIKD